MLKESVKTEACLRQFALQKISKSNLLFIMLKDVKLKIDKWPYTSSAETE